MQDLDNFCNPECRLPMLCKAHQLQVYEFMWNSINSSKRVWATANSTIVLMGKFITKIVVIEIMARTAQLLRQPQQ